MAHGVHLGLACRHSVGRFSTEMHKMKSYKLPDLSSKSSKDDRAKLVTALEAVQGVRKAILHTDKNSFEIEAEPKHEPKQEELMAAAATAGFPGKAN